MDLEESKCRMHNGKLYYAGQPELIADQLTYLEKNFDYNQRLLMIDRQILLRNVT